MPVLDAESWMKPTISRIIKALEKSDFQSEVIVIDDGSTDKSAEKTKAVKTPHGIPMRVISQKNTGRYLARKHGVEVASYENILFVDARVFIDEGSLGYLYSQLESNPDQLWNGHVNIDKKGNIFARFWDAIVFIAWRKYFRKPTRTSYGLGEFDYYPKGTGFFYAPKIRLQAAMKHFESHTNDIRFSSDDTLLIRYMIERQDINLSPEFSCLYHSRSTFAGFLKHAYVRGQLFVDGFFRPGTRFFMPLIIILLFSIGVVISILIWPLLSIQALVIGAALFVSSLFIGAILLGVELNNASALAILCLPFAVVYLVGLWRGVGRKIKRKLLAY